LARLEARFVVFFAVFFLAFALDAFALEVFALDVFLRAPDERFLPAARMLSTRLG
jgi:hypothetical protein